MKRFIFPILSIVFLIVLYCIYTFSFPKSKPSLSKALITKKGYTIVEYSNIFTPEECKTLIGLASSHKMIQSEVLVNSYGKDSSVDKDARKSKQVWLRDTVHPLLQRTADFTASITKFPLENQEETQIVMYEPGGMFVPHFDPCAQIKEDPEFCKKMNRGAEQRRYTLLIYLNDDYEEGETEFVNIGVKIKPKAGKGILFQSTYDDHEIIEQSMHKGCEVKKGNKWIFTKWVHPKPFPVL